MPVDLQDWILEEIDGIADLYDAFLDSKILYKNARFRIFRKKSRFRRE